jgi:hypothetical protein
LPSGQKARGCVFKLAGGEGSFNVGGAAARPDETELQQQQQWRRQQRWRRQQGSNMARLRSTDLQRSKFDTNCVA